MSIINVVKVLILSFVGHKSVVGFFDTAFLVDVVDERVRSGRVKFTNQQQLSVAVDNFP